MPEFPELKAGDELLMIRPKTRYTEQEITKVTVAKMARYKITVSDPDRPEYANLVAFDIRDGYSWDTVPLAKRVGSRGGVRIYTEDRWAYRQREDLADEYLSSRQVSLWQLRGGLSEKIREDRMGFVNALRRFEGLPEL
jgi:hypothetical protein